MTLHVLKQALRKCRGMGKAGMCDSNHPLAACIANYEVAINYELSKPLPQRDYLAVLCMLVPMSEYICSYTESHLVRGDISAEAWLHRALPLFYTVCDLEVL